MGHKDILEQIHIISTIIKNTLFFGSTTIQRPMHYYDINVIIKNSIYMAKLERNIKQDLIFKTINIIEEPNNKLHMVRCNHIEISLVFLHLLKNAAESLRKTENNKKSMHVKTYSESNNLFYRNKR